MTVFSDSSALVKLYADEPGHASVRGLRDVVVSQLARVEVPSALWRKHRLGELDADAARVLVSAFEADWSGSATETTRLVPVSVTATVLREAARLCAVHGLRAYDAVQLASAVAARAAVPDCTSVAAFDHRLRAAAAREGFDLVPTSLPP